MSRATTPRPTSCRGPGRPGPKVSSTVAEASSKELKGDDRQAFMSRCLKGEGQEKKLTAQQEKMKACNIEASQKQLKGDARRQFMSECLRKDGGEDLTVQQEKMATCNRQASDEHLKGDERRAYMSDCLRADKAGSHPAAAGGTRK